MAYRPALLLTWWFASAASVSANAAPPLRAPGGSEAPCEHVVLAGAGAQYGSRAKGAMGEYERISGASEGGHPLFSMRRYAQHTYQADGEPVRASTEIDYYLYYAPAQSLWVVGRKAPDEVKRQTFILAVGSHAPSPDKIHGVWSYNSVDATSGAGKWVGYAYKVHARCAVCGTIALSGLQSTELHSEYDGVYSLLPRKVHGRPAYRGGAHNGLYVFWLRRERAWVASSELGHPPRGKPFALLARSTAGSPDRVKGRWLSLRYARAEKGAIPRVERVSTMLPVRCRCHRVQATPAPTPSPSAAPSAAPSPAPTTQPTLRATMKPHFQSVPTFAPTPLITAAPTPFPTPLPVACGAVHLSGDFSPRLAKVAAAHMGLYTLYRRNGLPVTFGKRPVYVLSRPQAPAARAVPVYLFYYASMGGGSWAVGPNIGSGPFFFVARSHAVLPQMIPRRNTWTVFVNAAVDESGSPP
eukprot:g5036.t1